MFRPVLAAALFLVPLAAQAAGHRSASLEVVEPWSRPAVQGFNGVGYMTLVNHGARPETLVGVVSPAARTVEMHRSAMVGGVMSMAPAPRIAIPPSGSVRFAPGSYHLMFMGLKTTLKPGDRLPATLVFSDKRRIPVSFQVTSGEAPNGRSLGHSDAER